jgi:hypothetical protein
MGINPSEEKTMNYEDFDLLATDVRVIQEGGKKLVTFRLQVPHSPAGQLSESLKCKYDARQMSAYLDELETHPLDWPDMIHLGEWLSTALFPQDVRQLLHTSLAIVKSQQKRLRLRLTLAGKLHAIPWEYILLNQGGGEATQMDFLGLQPDISIVRHQAATLPTQEILAPSPARVVMAFASPASLPPLNIDEEQKTIAQALEDNPNIQPTFISAVTLDSLRAALNPAHLFHFAGHGDFEIKAMPQPGMEEGEGTLFFDNGAGDGAPLNAGKLAVQLRQAGVRVAVLTACQSGRRDHVNLWSSMAAALLRAEFGAVVGMQYPISDESAIAFVREFYKALAAGQTIDEAVTRGRIAISSSDVRGWGTPVLYLQSARGEVFPPPQAVPIPPTAPPPHPPIIPYPRSDIFVGREEEMGKLRDALNQSRIAIISGMGGIGKTQLAVEYSYQYKENYPDGVFWVQEQNWQTGLALLATDLGLSIDGMTDPEVERRKAAAFMMYARQHPKTLLVFDNLDDPRLLKTSVAGQVVQNLPCHILMTTQRNEKRPTYQTIHLDALRENDSFNLLLILADRTRIADTERNAALSICHSLGNWPLAIALAATYLRERPQIDLANYLLDLKTKGKLIILDTGKVDQLDLPTRHRAAVSATLRLQWDGLADDNAQLALKVAALLCEKEPRVAKERLSIFSGLSAEGELSCESPLNEALAFLQKFSLIEGENEHEIRLHTLVCEFASQQPLSSEAKAAFLENLRRLMIDREQSEVDRRQAALILTRSQWFTDFPAASAPPDELLNYLDLIGRSLNPEEYRYVLYEGIVRIPPQREDLSKRQQAHFWNFSAAFRMMSGDPGEFKIANRDYQAAEEKIKSLLSAKDHEPDDYKLAARVKLGLANLLSIRGRAILEKNDAKTLAELSKMQPAEAKEAEKCFLQAIPLYGEAIANAQRYGKDAILEAKILKETSYAYTLLAQWSDAEICYQRGVQVLQEHLRCYAEILETASQVYEHQARTSSSETDKLTGYKTAYELAKETIDVLQRSIGDADSLVYAHMNAADHLMEIHNITQDYFPDPVGTACQHWRAALPIARRLDMKDEAKTIRGQLKRYGN